MGLVRIETIVDGLHIKGGASWNDRGSGVGSLLSVCYIVMAYIVMAYIVMARALCKCLMYQT